MKTIAYASDSRGHTYTLVQNGKQFKWYSGSFPLATIPAFASREAATEHGRRLGWEVWQ